MHRRVGMMLGLAVLLPASHAWAQVRTLQDALAAAYSNNPTLQTARAQLRSVDENVPQALAGWRPQIALAGSIGYGDGTFRNAGRVANGGSGSPTGNTTSIIRNNRDIFTEQATVTQPLYRGGATRASTSRADNQVFAQRGRLLASEQQIFTNVVNAYVGVIQAQQVLQLNVDRSLQFNS